MTDPLVTLIVFSFNQEKHIREAVRAAFAQTYEPLEIIVSDDCSTDRTFEIIERETNAYDGPHTIITNRNEHNLGLIGQVNSILNRASGRLIALAAGDDISLPDRISAHVNAWQNSNENCHLIYSDMEMIDENGNVIHESLNLPVLHSQTIEQIVSENSYATGATCTISAEVFSEFGELQPDTLHEDRAWPLRAKHLGEIAYCPRVLVQYRSGGVSWRVDRTTKFTRFINDYHQKLSDLQTLSPVDNHLLEICNQRISELSLLLAVEEKSINPIQLASKCLAKKIRPRLAVEMILRRLFAAPIQSYRGHRDRKDRVPARSSCE